MVTITPEDDSLHPGSDDPHWNESSWFPFNIPDQRTSGWVMVFHRPNMQLSVGGIAVWDPTGEHPYDCLYYDWGDLWAMDPAWDMHRCALPNGLTVDLISPLEEIHVRYRGDGCTADLRWVATSEPIHSDWKRGGADNWGSGHFEQPGRMTGTLVLDDRQLEIACWSNRDHSWGPRRPSARPRADFPWALDADGNGFHAFLMSRTPAADDPIEGTSEPLLFGWTRIDGVTSGLTTAERHVLERGVDGRPLRLEVRGTDEMGRALVAEGECVNWLKWQGYPYTFQWWCMVRWTVNGREAYGEVQEFAPLQQSRRYLRRKNLEHASLA